MKVLFRPALLLASLFAGVCIPSAHILNNGPFGVMRLFLLVMVFMTCLQMEWPDLRIRAEHWRILTANLAFGLLPAGILAGLLPQSPDYARIAFFTGITPTAAVTPVVVSLLRGNVGYTLTGFLVTNIAVSLALLGLLPLLSGNFSWGFIGHVGYTLSVLVAAPFAAAVLLRWIWPAAKGLPARLAGGTFFLWVLSLFTVGAVTGQHFVDHPDASPALLLGAAGLSLVFCAAQWRIGERLGPGIRMETGQLLWQKNTFFTIYLALTCASPVAAMGPIFYTIWNNLLNAWVIYRESARRAE